MIKLPGSWPTPSSTWHVGIGGAVTEIRSEERPARAGKPLTGRVRAEVTCSVCQKTGHNARNKKKCRSAFVEAPANEVHDKTVVSPEQLAKSWLVRAQERVARLSREPTRKQPSAAVVESVRTLLSLLYLVDMKPSRIIATADGGISLWFIRERYKAILDISNDYPDIAVFAESTKDSEQRVSEVSFLRSHRELIPTLMKIWVSRLA